MILICPNGDATGYDTLVALENMLEPFPGRRLQDQTLMDGALALRQLVLDIRDVHIGVINDPILIILVLIPTLLLL